MSFKFQQFNIVHFTILVNNKIKDPSCIFSILCRTKIATFSVATLICSTFNRTLYTFNWSSCVFRTIISLRFSLMFVYSLLLSFDCGYLHFVLQVSDRNRWIYKLLIDCCSCIHFSSFILCSFRVLMIYIFDKNVKNSKYIYRLIY